MAPHLQINRFRVVMAEVDVAQIHFTAMLRWMDRGLSEWLAAVGHPFTELLAHGPGIPIVESRARFLRRVLLDDELTLTTSIGGIGRTSFRSWHQFVRGGELVVDGHLVHVCVERGSRATVPVPQWLRAAAVPGDAPPPAVDLAAAG